MDHEKKSIHAITKNLSKLVTNRKVIHARNKKRDKEKLFDSERKRVKDCVDENKLDSDQSQTSDEYAQDNIEGD
ncbi:MAG: hypothetical protein IMZ52_01300 [Actinobacteria bacterium]|nr:hypothetical protein [Actinomycetota bacterium]